MTLKIVIASLTLPALAAYALIPARLYSTPAPDMGMAFRTMLTNATPRPPAIARTYSVQRTAPLAVALVFGRAQGCADASPELIEDTARAATDAGVDAAVMAATVAVESSCNPFSVSPKGAIGLTQIMPRIWKDRYDFAGGVNLFNRADNLKVGSQILAGLIQEHGVTDGLRRYNGTGAGCDACDAGYTAKILTLAGRK